MSLCVRTDEYKSISIDCHLQNAQPHLLGSSVFGPNEIYGQLKAYKSRLAFDNPAGKL